MPGAGVVHVVEFENDDAVGSRPFQGFMGAIKSQLPGWIVAAGLAGQFGVDRHFGRISDAVADHDDISGHVISFMKGVERII